ncbi:MAG: 5-oxoprolinase subunit PxpB [Lacibacter sp.]
MQEIQFIPLSECAVLLSFGNTIDNAIHEKLMQVKRITEENPFPGFIETVPAYNSLTVFFNPVEVKKTAGTISASVIHQLKQIIETAEQSSVQKVTASTITIPVCYDEEYGIDLNELSVELKLSIKEIIELHTKQQYKVFMIGFTPGFPYMGILDEHLFTKRKAQPRISVAPGSVAIAGNQTGIYPLSTPGGWSIIGRTPLKLFDQQKVNPFLLKAGDTIQFTSITKKEFTTLSAVANPDSGFKH